MESDPQLIQYFSEFDQACALVGANEELLFIDDENVRDACSLIAGIGNQARMSYALLRYNAEHRKGPDIGADAFTPS